MKRFILGLIIYSIVNTISIHAIYNQEETIYLYSNDSNYANNVRQAFDSFNVKYEIITTIQRNDNTHLYILFDVHTIHQDMLPPFYIAYQSIDLTKQQPNNEYINKLKNAIAVWDYSWDNIAQYREIIFNYYYLPKNYEYIDPIILPCFLPCSALALYRDILIYSNQVNTEISSHIPILFFYSYMQKPQLIVEAGVALGYSSQIFSKVAQLYNAPLLGIDFDKTSQASYASLQNGTFLLMNDLNFSKFYATSFYAKTPIDIVFIDTSHEFHHTLGEINEFLPLLSSNGTIMFHDSNVTPLRIDGREGWWRLNNTTAKMNPLAPSNPRGVAPAIKQYFSIAFEESKYQNMIFTRYNTTWHLIHYPFCNGLTVIKKLSIS